MKFKTLFVALLAISTCASAQDCKVEKDAFTGAQTVSFSYKNESLVYKLVDGAATLSIKINYSGEFNNSVPAGTPFLLKSASDEIITLKSSKETFPVTSLSGSTIISQYLYVIDLDKATLEAITKDELTLMRYPDGKGGTTDMEFKSLWKKWGKALTKGANCLKENMK